MDINPTPPARFPPRMSKPATWAMWTWVILVVIDMSGMIVNIMAYTGAQSPDDRPVIKDTFVTFPPTGHHVQRAMIALPSLGLVMHIVLPILTPMRLTRLEKNFTLARTKQTRRWVILVPLLYHTVCLGAWAALLALQTDYVPILGTKKLPECVRFGDELSQCGMLTASWVLAMVFCATHCVMVLILVVLVKRLSYPQVESMPLNPASVDCESSPASGDTQKPSSGQAPAYVDLPIARAFNGVPRPNDDSQEPLPPYTEAKAQ